MKSPVILSLLFCLGAVSAAGAAGGDPADLEDLEIRVEAAIARCELDEALPELEAGCSEAEPERAAILRSYLEAVTAREERAFQEAAAELVRTAELALAMGDTAAAARLWRQVGEVRLRQGDADATKEAAGAALALLAGRAGADKLKLECRLLVASSHNLGGRLSLSDSLYAAILPAAEAGGWKTLAGDAWNGRGVIGSKQRQPSVSIPFFERALALAREAGDLPRTARVLNNLGYDHSQARRADEALAHYEGARDLADRCGLEHILGFIHTGFGAIAELQGDRERAIEHFRDSYLAHAAVGNLRGELGGRQRLAYDLMISGHYTEALTHYERCLEIIEERDNDYLLNWVLGGLALTNHKLGHLDRAEDFYTRARVANEAMGDRMSAAWCLLSLGWLEMLRGEYREALIQSRGALDAYRELGDAEGIADALVVTAEVHYRLGNWDRALGDYERAADLSRESGLEEALNRAYRGLAQVCRAAGRPSEARRYCEQALELARSWSDADGTIWALLQLAEQNIDEGQQERARRHLAAAAARQEADGQFDFRSWTRLLQARCAADPREAVGLAEEALALAEEGCIPEREWEALTQLGRHHLAAGDTAAARRSQLRAIEVVESLRRAVGTDELRRNMLRPALEPYERMIELCLGAERPGPDAAREALGWSERCRARILAARLRSSGTDAGLESAGTAVSDGEREYLAGIAYLQAKLQQPGVSPDERTNLRAEVARLEEEIHYLRLDGGGRAVPGDPGPADGPDPASCVRPDEQAVSFFLGRDVSAGFHVADGRVRAWRLPPRKTIEDRVRRYLSLRAGSTVPEEVRGAAEREILSLLLGPMVGNLDGHRTLIVAPDGILHRLPFAALRGESARLVDRHEVFTVPSLQSLGWLRRRDAARQAEGTVRDLSILAVGCGQKPGGSEDGARVHPFDGSPVAALAGAGREAREIAALFDRSLVLTGSAADEASFKRAPLDRAEVLHIAAHSWADEREVRRSYVLLSPAGAATAAGGEDGLLQWHEAAALDLGASLVTLASCRSAGGVLSVGEGVTGLTQAFLFAGGTCVLAAQSDVGDESTRRFMTAFYERLRAGESAAEALAGVQRRLASSTEGEEMNGAWADFVLVGDGSVRLASASPAVGLPHPAVLAAAAACALLLPLGISLVRRRRRT